MDEKHIKIHISIVDGEIAGESVWALDLGDNKAEINNIPFFAGDICSLHDIVRYEEVDGIKEFREILESVTRTWGITWEPTDKNDFDGTTAEWRKLADHLKENDVNYESAYAGALCVALPADKTEEENITWLKALKYSSPIPLTLYIGPNDEEDSD